MAEEQNQNPEEPKKEIAEEALKIQQAQKPIESAPTPPPEEAPEPETLKLPEEEPKAQVPTVSPAPTPAPAVIPRKTEETILPKESESEKKEPEEEEEEILTEIAMEEMTAGAGEAPTQLTRAVPKTITKKILPKKTERKLVMPVVPEGRQIKPRGKKVKERSSPQKTQAEQAQESTQAERGRLGAERMPTVVPPAPGPIPTPTSAGWSIAKKAMKITGGSLVGGGVLFSAAGKSSTAVILGLLNTLF